MLSVDALTSFSFFEASEMIWNGLTAETLRNSKVRVCTFCRIAGSKMSPFSASTMIVTMLEPPKVSANFSCTFTYGCDEGNMSEKTVFTSTSAAK